MTEGDTVARETVEHDDRHRLQGRRRPPVTEITHPPRCRPCQYSYSKRAFRTGCVRALTGVRFRYTNLYVYLAVIGCAN